MVDKKPIFEIAVWRYSKQKNRRPGNSPCGNISACVKLATFANVNNDFGKLGPYDKKQMNGIYHNPALTNATTTTRVMVMNSSCKYYSNK